MIDVEVSITHPGYGAVVHPCEKYRNPSTDFGEEYTNVEKYITCPQVEPQ
jgi:hypothetical protein